MKLIEIRLVHYRAVQDRTLRFRESGITLVHGPNEIGKSSIIEAVDIVLKYQATSNAQEVLSLKPLNRDEGTEIYLTFAAGPYLVQIFKRFHKKPETVLQIHQPRAEQLSGQEAHNRLRQILAETMDETLFRALRIQQGVGVSQAGLGEAASLQDALDRAAGGSSASRDELTLFEKVQGEYQRYWTLKKANPTGLYSEATKREQQAAEALARVKAVITDAENDAERLDRIEKQIDDWSQQLRVDTDSQQGMLDQLEACQLLHRRHQQAATDLRDAEHTLTRAQWTWQERQNLLDEEAKSRAAQAQREEDQRALDGDLSQAKADLIAAEQEFQVVDADYHERQETEHALSNHREYLRELRATMLLAERLENARRAHQGFVQAKTQADATAITEEDLQAIRAQQRQVDKAEAALAVGGASLVVERLGDAPVWWEDHPLAASEQRQAVIAQDLTVTVPGIARIVVRPGSTVHRLTQTREKEQKHLQQLLAQVDAVDLDAAERLWRDKSDYRTTESNRRSELSGILAGEALANLEDQLVAGSQRVESYRQLATEATHHWPDGLEALETLLADANQALTESRERRSHAEGSLIAQKTLIQGLGRRQAEIQAEVRAAAETLTQVRTKLQEARPAMPDQAAQDAVAIAGLAVKAAVSAVEDLEEELRQADPEMVEVRYSQLLERIERLKTNITESQKDQRELRGHLQGLGAEGIYQKLGQALTEWTRARHQLDNIEAQAEAASLLYRTMEEERERTQERYRRPLEDQINRLGRVLGPDFMVELGTDLTVVRRHLADLWVPFESLSSGAQEQVVFLTKLAAAQLVAGVEGIPVVLDDALGSSDDRRLERMSTVLNVVGRTCQIIILTASLDRFQWVSSADFVDVSA